jgi:hypothetical protein
MKLPKNILLIFHPWNVEAAMNSNINDVSHTTLLNNSITCINGIIVQLAQS